MIIYLHNIQTKKNDMLWIIYPDEINNDANMMFLLRRKLKLTADVPICIHSKDRNSIHYEVMYPQPQHTNILSRLVYSFFQNVLKQVLN